MTAGGTTLARRRRQVLRALDAARDTISEAERDLAEIDRRIAIANEIARRRTAHRPIRKAPAAFRDARNAMRAEGWV